MRGVFISYLLDITCTYDKDEVSIQDPRIIIGFYFLSI